MNGIKVVEINKRIDKSIIGEEVFDEKLKIFSNIKNKSIIGISLREGILEREDEKTIISNQGDIILHLNDGSKLICWNSEWGGIGLEK